MFNPVKGVPPKQKDSPPTSPLMKIFDKPDGDECLLTTAKYTAYGGIFGTVVSVVDMVSFNTPGTVSGAMTIWAKHLLPMAAIGGMYSTVVCISANLRQKDDQFNHFFAGLAAGSIYGVKYRRQTVGWAVGLSLGLVGMMAKRTYQYDWKLMPEKIRKSRGFNAYRHSYFTERPDPEGKADL